MTWFNRQRMTDSTAVVDEFECECDPHSQDHYDLIAEYLRGMPAGRYLEDGQALLSEDDNPPV